MSEVEGNNDLKSNQYGTGGIWGIQSMSIIEKVCIKNSATSVISTAGTG